MLSRQLMLPRQLVLNLNYILANVPSVVFFPPLCAIIWIRRTGGSLPAFRPSGLPADAVNLHLTVMSLSFVRRRRIFYIRCSHALTRSSPSPFNILQSHTLISDSHLRTL